MLLSKVLQDALPELKRGFGVVADYEEYALFKNNGMYSKLWKLVIMKASEAQSVLPEFKTFVGMVDDANQVHLVENFSVNTAFINRVKRGDLGDEDEIL
jgi:hypothetical protein